MGYEATANSGVIVPLRTDATAASSTANGILYSGTGTGTTSNNGTITMSSVTETSNYELYITASSVSNAINMQLGDNTGNYIGCPNSKNTARLYTSASDNTAYTLTVGTNDAFTLECKAADTGSKYKYLKFNNNSGSYRFANYSSDPEKIVFYKKTLSTPSMSFSPSSLTATIGQAYTLPTLTSNAESGTVTYSSNNTTVADVNSTTGELTLKSAGEATITATAAATATQNTASASYALTVEASSVTSPSIDKASGDYAYNTAVTITTTESNIYYTTDGTDPYSSGTAVDADGTSATVYITGDMTLTAISLDASLNASAPTIREYTVTKPDAPTFTLAEGSYIGTQSVTINSPAGTVISYTTDDTDPSTSGTATLSASNSVSVSVSTTSTIRAITIDGNAIESAEVSATYTIYTSHSMPFAESFNNTYGDFTTENVSGYADVWKKDSNGFIKGSSYASSTNNAAESWLESPFITIDANAVLTFDHSSRYFKDEAAMKAEATLWYRELNGSWQQLTIDNYPGNSNLNTFVTATIELPAALSGKNIQLGFKYLGSTTNAGTWEIKNLELMAAPTFTLSTTSETIAMGGVETVDVTLTTNTDGEITAVTDDDKVATVSLKSAGVYTITAVAAGSATITLSAVKTANFRAATGTVSITVTDDREDAGISFAKDAEEITLGAAYTGQMLTNTNSLVVTYSSTDESVATVAADGVVTVLAAGETVIKASFAGNAIYKKAVAQYTLTVNKKATGIEYSVAEAEAKLGKAFVAPTLSNPNGLDVTYESTKPSVATIDGEGVITIVAEGTTTIKATFTENDEYLGTVVSYTLNVVDPAKIVISFNDNDQSISGNYEQEATLSYTIKGVGIVMKKTGTETQPRVDGAEYSSTLYARIYNGNTLTITAPGNLNFSSIAFDFNKGSLTSGGTTYKSTNTTWTGTAHEVVFTGAETTFINSITVAFGSENITISSSKYLTYCSDYDLDFSGKGVTAYKAAVDGDNVVLTAITGNVVPANTGVILVADAAGTFEIPLTTTDATVTGNEMVGVTTVTAVPWEAGGSKYNYILQKKEGESEVKFYKATGANLKANRAYLSTTYNVAAAGARGLNLVFADDMTTSLREMRNEEGEMRNVYNLNGQRVSQPTKGLYIVNGKKYVVK